MHVQARTLPRHLPLKPTFLSPLGTWLLAFCLAAACGGSSTDRVSRVTPERNGNPATGDAGVPTSDGGGSTDAVPSTDETGTRDTDGGFSADEPSPRDDDTSPGVPSVPDPGVRAPGPSADPNLPQFDCSAVSSQQFDSESMRGYQIAPEVAEQVESVLSLMSPVQKASQLLGVDGSERNYRDMHRSPDVAVPRVGIIRGFRYRDAGRGVALDAGQDNRLDQKNFSTAFPTPSLRAASWDLDLERRIGAAIGDETAASNNNALLAPCMNLVRHPYWGRTQETYGEDPYLVGRMATAFTVGAQQYVMACAKHFLANNIERLRSMQDAVMSEQTLREIYGRHFEMVVQDAGVGCVMAAYNGVNGVKSTQNEHLLRDVLRGPIDHGGMGFDGIVLSDWWAMPGDQEVPDAATAQAITNEALVAGLDVELPWTLHYSESTLAKADQTLVEQAARRALTQKYRFETALDTDDWGPQPPTSVLTDGSIAANEVHEALAEEAALKSAVLLVNGRAGAPTLPLFGATNVAVVGIEQPFVLASSTVPKSCTVEETNGHEQTHNSVRSCTFLFATDPALGDRGTSRINADPTRSFGPFAGISQAAGATRNVTSGNTADAATGADAVVVVVGYTPEDEGEEYTTPTLGDRSSLDLPPGHAELVARVLDLNLPTVIVVESGSIVNVPWLSHPNQNQATIWAGYPGMRGGLALGKLIFGEANFSGKLPMAWPAESELPAFKDAETTTAMSYYFGYRLFDKRRYIDGTATSLIFPFGHGLSYSSFDYSNLTLPCQTVSRNAVINVTVDITNTSSVDGDEVAMLFVKPPPKLAGIRGERPWKQLESFARVRVPAGQTVTAELPLRIRDLRRWEGEQQGEWVIDSGDYTIAVGKNADDAESTANAGTLTVQGD